NLPQLEARGAGGGVYIIGSPAFNLVGNSVLSNKAGFWSSGTVYLFGGGILVQDSQGTLTANTISYNQANRYTIFGNGGGLAALTSTVMLHRGQIAFNKTSTNYEGYGGGVYGFNSSVTIDA